MKKLLLLLILIACSGIVNAQDKSIEQLKKELAAHPKQDTSRVNRLLELSYSFELESMERKEIRVEAITISKKIGYRRGEGIALAYLGFSLVNLGQKQEGDSLLREAGLLEKKANDPELTGTVNYLLALILYSTTGDKKALEYFSIAEEGFEKSGNYRKLANCQSVISDYYLSVLSNYPLAMEYLLKSIHSAEKSNSSSLLIQGTIDLSYLYSMTGDHENAIAHLQKAEQEMKNTKTGEHLIAGLQNAIGEAYRLSGRYQEAIPAYKLAIKHSIINRGVDESNLADVYTHLDSLSLAFQYGFSALSKIKKYGNKSALGWINGILARAYLKKGMPDSSIYYARMGLDSSTLIGTLEFMRDNAAALANAYAYKKDFAKAYPYHLQYINYRDSMLNTEVRNRTAVLKYNNDLGKKEAQISQLNMEKKGQRNFLISVSVILGLIVISAIGMLRSIRQKQKANKLLQKQKNLIEEQRDQTNKALANLTQTQAQLIQSEKMASLGELTAGIAHEIQNPLNFVNNFSEVNKELIADMKTEIEKGNLEEVKAIAGNIESNEEKINHHGKRADAIVKGMLQHSRSSNGVKEPTDINALCDEYLRLSYHGLRAKDKSFNAIMKTDFDTKIGKINIIAQDIGRVVLNLLTNAFYVVHEKKKSGIEGFEPTVTIATRYIRPPSGGQTVEIKVSDNGGGMPQKVLDKIFQPFFTTKPTGQGTGLGLSLSYDIVTKGHGGELKVETKEGEGSEFIIQLPI